MKKLLSVLLAVILAFSSIAIAVSAAEEPVPLIILRGYSGPHLAYADDEGNPIYNDDGTVKKAWPLDTDKLISDVEAALLSVATGKITLYDALVEVFKDTLAPLEILPDGTSVYNLIPYPSGAANTSVSYIVENGLEDCISETELIEIAKEKGLSEDEIFCFSHDWRKSQLEYAASLDNYIQEVKEITGAEKVDIFGLSHAGQYTATYFYYYGDKCDVRKAMLANPATLGTTICGSLFTGEELEFDFETLMAFLQHSLETEEDFEKLISLIPLDQLTPILNNILKEPDIEQGVMCIPSLWDLVPADRFDEALAYAEIRGTTVWPDGKLSDKILANSKVYHKTVAADGNLAAKLKELTQGTVSDIGSIDRIQIGYIVGTGYGSLNGCGNNSDYVIDTYLSSGSDCAKLGETFPEGYVQANENCTDPTHYHMSPEFDIDASTGILPDSTWYINGQGHGMFIIDKYSESLITEFFWGNIVNVYSDKNYPQFNLSQNTSEILYARFDNTSSGYHSSQDEALLINNMSVVSDIRIWEINSTGAKVEFEYNSGMKVKMGESVALPIIYDELSGENELFSVEIVYTVENAQLTTCKDTLKFTSISDEQLKQYSHLSLIGVPCEEYTALDARIALQSVAGMRTLTVAEQKHVDINADGKVTALDARLILQRVAGA